MKYILLFTYSLLLICCAYIPTTAQTPAELVEKIRLAKEDTNKVNLLYDLTRKYWTNKTDTAKILAQQILDLSTKLNFERGKADAYASFGLIERVRGNLSVAYKHYQTTYEIAKKIGHKRNIAIAYNGLGVVNYLQGDYPNAVEYYLKSIILREELHDKVGLASTYNNLGVVAEKQTKYDEALSYYEKSLRIYESLNDKAGMSANYNNLGIIYKSKNDLDKALMYYEKSLKIKEELKDKAGMAMTINNLGVIYEKKEKLLEAKEMFKKALKLNEELKRRSGIVYCYINISNIDVLLGNYEEAEILAVKSFNLSKETNEKDAIKSAADAMYKVYEVKKDYAKALEYYKLFVLYKDSVNNIDNNRQIANLKVGFDLEKKQKEIELLQKDKTLQALDNQRKADLILLLNKEKAIKDIENQKKEQEILLLNQQQNLQKIENSKKEQAIELLEKSKTLQQAQLKMAQQQQLITQEKQELHQVINVALVVGVSLLALLLFNMYRNAKKQQEANKILHSQKEAIQQQADQINQMHSDIMSSINYARRIQTAMLPMKETISEGVGKDNFFIVYQPKDIVSGDFYFYEEVVLQTDSTAVESQLFLAVADCTGHGVPGAFMSMISSQILSEIILKENIREVHHILQQLNIEVQKALKQTDKGGDGLDIGLLSVLKYQENEHSSPYFSSLCYAGAKTSLLYCQNGELHEIKGTRKSIGDGSIYTKKFSKEYELHTIDLHQSPTVLYLTSDGFQDQFGGTQKRKFSYKQLKALLQEIHHQPLAIQQQTIETTLTNWIMTGNEHQTDDITIVGLKIS